MKNLLHFYIQKKEFLKITITISSKIIKYLGKNLTKEVEDLFSENYKIPLKEITWKDNPCSCVKKLKVVKMPIFHKLMYRFNTISIKIPGFLFLQKLTS